MTPAALRATLQRLRLSQLAAARLLGVNARTMRAWVSTGANHRMMPEVAVRLLWAVEHVPGVREGLGSLPTD